jgi:hypothetical protein
MRKPLEAAETIERLKDDEAGGGSFADADLVNLLRDDVSVWQHFAEAMKCTT